MFNNFFFFPENRAVYEILSKKVVEPERRQTILRMRVACWLRNATRAQAHTHTEMCNTYCFSTASQCFVTVHCLSCNCTAANATVVALF